MVIVYSGEYPGISAGAKRIALYQQGIQDAGLDVSIVSSFRKSRSWLGFYFNLFLQPFIIISIFKKKIANKKILFVYGYSWETLLLIRLVSFMKNQKMVYEINEKPQSYYTNRITEIPFIKKTNLIILTRIVFPLLDGFVVISENLKEYISMYQKKEAKVIKVPILINARVPNLLMKNILLPKHFLLHTGALSERKDGIVGVFKAFALANKKMSRELHFYLTDKVAPKNVWDEIAYIIEENGLSENVHFLGRLSEDELFIYQTHCCMLILNKPNNEQNKYNFSTKLGEYLRLGKPIIYTPVGEMSYYLKDGINAFEVPINSPKILADKILYILNNKDTVTQIANAGIQLAQEVFDYRIQGKRLKFYFDKLLKC